ncbi:MAG TPA: hypothetical protein VMK65_04545, partial [Longimicrobiales bacterium]|nr:hypothetical protein [Longimicrobiales bacterium]
TAQQRSGLAGAFYAAREWEEARSLCLDLHREDPASVDVLGRLGTIAARLGEEAEARRIEAELATLERPYLWGSHTHWRSHIAGFLGEKDRAVALLREAWGQGWRLGSEIHTDMDVEALEGHPAFEELRRPIM